MARIVVETDDGVETDSFDVDPFTWGIHVEAPQTNVDARQWVNRIDRALREAGAIERTGKPLPERPSEKAMRLTEERFRELAGKYPITDQTTARAAYVKARQSVLEARKNGIDEQRIQDEGALVDAHIASRCATLQIDGYPSILRQVRRVDSPAGPVEFTEPD